MNNESKLFEDLDLSPEEFRKLGYRVIDMIADYYKSIRELPVFPDTTSQEVAERFTEDLPESGQPADDILDEWQSKVLPYSTHMGSPRYFGYVMGSGTMISTLAEALTAAVNTNAGGWKPAPAAAEIERRTISWIAEMIHYPRQCGGLFTSGGTMANFTAIETALRNTAPYDTTSRGLQDKPFKGKFTIYMSDHEGHISIIRVADLLNLGRDSVRLVKSKDDFTMDTHDLERKLDADIADGCIPFCVVAQVGSINVGAIDPLVEIAEICKERNLWFHADGACGAVGAILPDKRIQYKGLELADSVTLDPHKWLYIPYECGCVLVRDPEKLRRSFSLAAPYLEESGQRNHDNLGIDYYAHGPQMSRGFRALKVWMSLKHYGVEGYRKLISQNVKCAAYLDTLVRNSKSFKALHNPNLFMYCFQYWPAEIEKQYSTDEDALFSKLDLLNQQLVDEIQRSGEAFITTSKLKGRVVIRMSICSHRTTLADMDDVFDKLTALGD